MSIDNLGSIDRFIEIKLKALQELDAEAGEMEFEQLLKLYGAYTNMLHSRIDEQIKKNHMADRSDTTAEAIKIKIKVLERTIIHGAMEQHGYSEDRTTGTWKDTNGQEL